MRQATLFISVKPVFANKILDGSKTVELRRVRPSVRPDDMVLIYSSSPEMALLGSAWVKDIMIDDPSSLWEKVKDDVGITRRVYEAYFVGANAAVGIRLRDVRRLVRPISLQEIRVRWPWLRPPQSYRYVCAQLELNGSGVAALTPAA